MTAFAWEGEHLAIDLPGAHVVFTTRRGGVSAGPYASLNLGFLTDDDPAAIAENRARVQALTPRHAGQRPPGPRHGGAPGDRAARP